MASIKKAIVHKGFSFIEVITQCPVQFGRKTGRGSSVEMLMDYKAKSISFKDAAKLSPEELTDKITVGELVDQTKPEMIDELRKMIKKVSSQ